MDEVTNEQTALRRRIELDRDFCQFQMDEWD